MCDDIKRQFIQATFHFKKVDMCELSHGAIPIGELYVLRQLQQDCPRSGTCLNVAEISEQLCVTRSAVSQILSSLEGKGYIIRQIDTSDRRRIAVQATHEGKRALEKSQRGYDHAMDLLLESISPTELDTLIRLMNRLTCIYNDLKSQNQTTE